MILQRFILKYPFDFVYFKVFDLGLGRPKYPITGLEFCRVPNSKQYIIVATAPDGIYTFQDNLRSEERTLQPLFATYVNGTQSFGFEEAKTDINYSVLRLYAPPNEKYPQQWGFLTGSGIRHGDVCLKFLST